MAGEVTIWTVYNNPEDYPGKWVLRGFNVGAGIVEPHAECVVTDSLREIHSTLPHGVTKIPLAADDDLAIYETWI